MSLVTVAATQGACSWDLEDNVEQAESLVRSAAAQGADIILLQELFATPYFCKDELSSHFALAAPAADHPLMARFSALAKELGVVLPISFFEEANNSFFNSIAILDADGTILGVYRKSHIPDGPGYEEKFYFSPGDTGFKVWKTQYATIGVGICWDQWFPESARAMALQGAEVLLYPTAIGSEPSEPTLSTTGQWQRSMQGHSACNMVPVVASNRVGFEEGTQSSLTFYGHSFITDHTGMIVAEANDVETEVVTASFDFKAIAESRFAFGLFRDRRPDLYGPLLTLDGGNAERLSF
jgi:N-carbamoylputrescine amidase